MTERYFTLPPESARKAMLPIRSLPPHYRHRAKICGPPRFFFHFSRAPLCLDLVDGRVHRKDVQRTSPHKAIMRFLLTALTSGGKGYRGITWVWIV